MWPQNIRRVAIFEHRCDFRKRFDGLLAESYRLGFNPYQGDCIVFLKGDRSQLRALVGDRIGLYLVCRRFEGGRLQALFQFAREPKATTISMAELMMLFEGASFTVHKRVRAWR